MCSEISIYAILWSSTRKSTLNKTHLMRNATKYNKMKNYELLCILTHKGGNHTREQSYKRAGVCEFPGGWGEVLLSYSPLESVSQKQGHELNKYALEAFCPTGKF